MRLFVSAFVAFAVSAAATAVSAQEYERPVAPAGAATIGTVTLSGQQNGQPLSEQEKAVQEQADKRMQIEIEGINRKSQAGCPVVLSSARLNWPASYLPVTSALKVTEPDLALGFHNASGKGIRSVTITARFLGKRNVYQLDADAFDLRLTFSGVDAADKAAEQLREIPVPSTLHAYGVTSVSLEDVMFADGTFWTALGNSNCSLDVQGSVDRVAK